MPRPGQPALKRIRHAELVSYAGPSASMCSAVGPILCHDLTARGMHADCDAVVSSS